MSSPRFESDFTSSTNTSEAGPEVALFNNHGDTENFNHIERDSIMQRTYDTRTITKQTVPKLQINSRFGTFTRKTCESIEKFHLETRTDDPDNYPSTNGTTVEKASDESGIEDSPSHESTNRTEKRSNISNEEYSESADQLRSQLNDAFAERDQAIAALRAYEELLKKINENKSAKKRLSAPPTFGNGTQQNESSTPDSDGEKLVKRNAILERTVDNLEQTVQDTMSRMNEIKDVNQELKNVLTDQQDMLAQYKSTIEQKSFEYRDLQVKHEARIDSLVTENKRDRALLEKQITLLRAEAHMKSLENERLESECRIKGEQLARLTEMLNELRKAY